MRKLIVNEPQTEGRRGVTSSSSTLEDVRVGVRLKISALWIAMLFLFAYGDIVGFFNPGQIEEVISGEISGIEITQVFLLAVSVYIAIASVMIFLSLVLRPTVCRWTQHRAGDPVQRLDRLQLAACFEVRTITTPI